MRIVLPLNYNMYAIFDELWPNCEADTGTEGGDLFQLELTFLYMTPKCQILGMKPLWL